MLQLVFALLAGMLTVASPCILPVLPIILGATLGRKNTSRPLFIIFGFVVFFTLASLLLSVLVQHTGFDPNLVRKTGVFILALFGLLLIWPKLFEVISSKLSPLVSRLRPAAGPGNQGHWGAFLFGATLGVVWTPCAGPVLAAILTLIALQHNLLAAAILLFAYAVGASLPMLLIAYGGQYITAKVGALAKYSRTLQQIFGFIIILLAVAMYFNYDILVYAFLLQYFPALNPKL